MVAERHGEVTLTRTEAAVMAVVRTHGWADLANRTDGDRGLVRSSTARALAHAGLLEIEHGRARLTPK